jgi:hypothetical protein
MHLFNHLWAGAPAPPEYAIFSIFYDRLGWTPLELRQQPAHEIVRIMAMVEVENKVARRKAQQANKKR